MTQRNDESTLLEMDFGEALQRLVRVNPRTSEEAPESDKAAPFVKWVGGKRSIIEELTSRMPKDFGRYWEPFVGGGALFFEINDRLKAATLSDNNLELTITYNVVKNAPEALITKLEEHQRKNSEEYYYKVREQHAPQDPVDMAARLIYLNKTGYNGLYRVNKKGEFNVPYGRYANPDVVTRENIRLCSKALQKADIFYRQFEENQPNAGDFAYCDPPYHPVSATASFTKYTQHGFGEKEQAQLRDWALTLHKQGVKVMLSNSDTPLIRNLYKGSVWHLAEVQAPRMVNCKPEKRGAVGELIITNYQ